MFKCVGVIYEYRVLFLFFIVEIASFLSFNNVYLRKLNDYFAKSIFLGLIPFTINFEYNNAVLLLFLGLKAGIYGII